MESNDRKSLDNNDAEPLVRSQLRDLIECTICLETFTDPVALPCQHTFCRRCLQDFWSRAGDRRGGTVPCPMCRKEIVVPKDGSATLDKDFKMNRLIDIYQSETTTTTTPGATKESAVACPIHRTRALDVYCCDCMEVTCASCFLGRHGGHRGTDVASAADAVRGQLEREIDLVSHCVVRSLDGQTRQRAETFRFLDDVTKIESEIIDASEALKRTIDAHRDRLLGGLDATRNRVQRDLERKDKELDECVAAAEAFKTRCCRMKATAGGSAGGGEICGAVKGVHRQSIELQMRCDAHSLSANAGWKISFRPTDLKTVSQDDDDDNLVGRIEAVEIATTPGPESRADDTFAEESSNVCEIVDMPRGSTSSLLTLTSPETSFEVSETAWSVAAFKEWICVLLRNPTSIQFHRSVSPYGIEDEFKMASIVNPWNMKPSDVSHCLYVTDKDARCVWKVSPGERSAAKWIPGIEDPFRVSVTAEGQVIVPRWGKRACLNIFRPDGTGSERIYLPTIVIEPRDVLMTSSGEMIISNRWSDTKSWGVTRLTRKGLIVQRFDPTNPAQRLNYPAELCLGPDGCVFVADFNNNRVVELDAVLRWKGVLLTKENDFIEKPKSLCFDDTGKRLMVAYNGKVRVVGLET